ncbi:MAG: anhydro-N-acetylmuramic acid kinase [Prevotellaceae bacterium]|jgi:anhydro-N-acetylmuramic acid kinase|nr:anhydro-N-acetylmuramic acid kinase [Prevotellaceae bacterium]
MASDSITVLGLMSGTSLDGLDLCLASFQKQLNRWIFKIMKAQTFPYPPQLKQRLQHAHTLNAPDFILLHKEYGRFLGEQSKHFLNATANSADYIASHGHTIFHQPEKGITFQIGCGANIAAATGVSTIHDFRSLDVALGGQGAPLVPIGDNLLFPDYDICLNLGGFANISYNDEQGNRVAFDICPCNIVLNQLVKVKGTDCDTNGNYASQGTVCEPLLKELNSLAFYSKKGAKSLSREWVEQGFMSRLEGYDLSAEDHLRTMCEHIAMQISKNVSMRSMLVSGGGAHNSFLMNKIREHCDSCRITVPNKEIVDFKEALIFAFLGALYVSNENNTLSSATGASRNSIGGTLVKTTKAI